jgi:hypothetical protein
LAPPPLKERQPVSTMIMANLSHAVGLSSPYAGGRGLAFISYRGGGERVDFSAKNFMVFFTKYNSKKYHGAYKMGQSLVMVSIWVRARFGGGGEGGGKMCYKL